MEGFKNLRSNSSGIMDTFYKSCYSPNSTMTKSNNSIMSKTSFNTGQKASYKFGFPPKNIENEASNLHTPYTHFRRNSNSILVKPTTAVDAIVIPASLDKPIVNDFINNLHRRKSCTIDHFRPSNAGSRNISIVDPIKNDGSYATSVSGSPKNLGSKSEVSTLIPGNKQTLQNSDFSSEYKYMKHLTPK